VAEDQILTYIAARGVAGAVSRERCSQGRDKPDTAGMMLEMA